MTTKFYSQDDDFCSNCGSILELPVTAPTTVSCKVCSTSCSVKEKDNQLVSRFVKTYERDVADTDGIEQDDSADALVEHVCSKCGHTKASWSTMQTRSADEGQTVFYTCLKCKHKEIEYS